MHVATELQILHKCSSADRIIYLFIYLLCCADTLSALTHSHQHAKFMNQLKWHWFKTHFVIHWTNNFLKTLLILKFPDVGGGTTEKNVFHYSCVFTQQKIYISSESTNYKNVTFSYSLTLHKPDRTKSFSNVLCFLFFI